MTLTSSRPQVVACRDAGGDVVTCCRAMRGDIKLLWPGRGFGRGIGGETAALPRSCPVPSVRSE